MNSNSDPAEFALLFYQLTSLIAGLLHLVLTLFVISRNLRAIVNRVYLIWGVSLAVWNLDVFIKSFHSVQQNPEWVMFLLRILHLSLIFLPLSMAHLSMLIARISYPRLLRFLYAIHLGFAVLVFTPWYFDSYHDTPYGPMIDVKPAVVVFGALTMLISYPILLLLYRLQKNMRGLHRTRVRSLLIVLSLFALIGAHDYLLLAKNTVLISPRDLPQAAELARQLRLGQSPFAQWVWTRLSPAAKRLLENDQTAARQKASILAREFNQLLSGGSLLGPGMGKGALPSPSAAAGMAQPMSDVKLIQLNRMQLEQAFPRLVAKKSTFSYPWTHVPLMPLGNLAAILFGLVASYSVLQHQLLDIHVNLSWNAAQLVRLSFMFLTSFFLLLVFRILVSIWGIAFPPSIFYGCLAVLLATILIAARTFPRFFGSGDEKWERRLLGDWFEYHDKVRGFTRSLPLYTNTDLLVNDLHALLVNTVMVRRYQIILLDESRRSFSLFRAHPDEPAGPVPGLSLESPIFKSIRQNQTKYLTCKLAYAVPGESALEREAREQLQRWDPELCFPFFHGEDPFGLLILGEKVSEEPYTRHDIQLLSELVNSASLILNQIRLKNQLLQAEEMDLLGTMSRGLAHDLNNLLTPVSTFLQLAGEGRQDPEMTEHLLPTALRNVNTIRAYVKEALFFSKTQSLQLQETSLDKVVGAAVDLAQDKLKTKSLKAAIDIPADCRVVVDSVLIQRLIANLLSNAIDASPPDKEIRVTANRLARVESSRDWFRLRIIDQGVGISGENLNRVATPYFTTKNLGNETRGFGLGLAICRKIVHLHGGHLVIMSKEQKGTTVQVDLPDRQNA